MLAGEPLLLGSLDLWTVAVGLPARRLADVARPRSAREVLGSECRLLLQGSPRVSCALPVGFVGASPRERSSTSNCSGPARHGCLGFEDGLNHRREQLREPRRHGLSSLLRATTLAGLLDYQRSATRKYAVIRDVPGRASSHAAASSDAPRRRTSQSGAQPRENRTRRKWRGNATLSVRSLAR